MSPDSPRCLHAHARFSAEVAKEYRERYRKMHNLVITAHRAERDVSSNMREPD